MTNRELIDVMQLRNPHCDVRIVPDVFTGGRVELRDRRAIKRGREYIVRGWYFAGYVDDITRDAA